jgi:hypothetical protein
MSRLNGTPPRNIRLYQCPGCWSWGMHKVPATDGSLECECGERMACIDLRGEGKDDRAVWNATQHGTLVR